MFLFQLAVMAGEWDYTKIERGLTARKFLAWEAFAQLEPFGDKRDDYRAASIRQMIFNMAVDVKDRQPVDTFLLKFERVERKTTTQPWQEKKAIAFAVAMAYSKPSKTTELDSEQKARAMAGAVMQTLSKPKE